MLNENFIYMAAAVEIIGSLSYLRDTFRGVVQPNRASWVIWGLIPIIAGIAEVNEGVGLRSIITFTYGATQLSIFLTSFLNKKAYWKLERFDYGCAALSVAGVALWVVTGDGILALSFAIAADVLAAVPTVKKAFFYPDTENYHPFLGGAISASIALLVVDEWYYANWAFPMYIFLICALFILLIRFRLGEKLRAHFSENS